MKPNLNFENEYQAIIDKANREKALALIKKISHEKPKLKVEADIRFKDKINGDLIITIHNTSAFDFATKRVIFNYFNSIRKFYTECE